MYGINRFTEIFEGATEKLFEAHGLRKDVSYLKRIAVMLNGFR